jgi:6-phosphogluconolactonase
MTPLRFIAVGVLLFVPAVVLCQPETAPPTKLWVFIGTYTGPKSQGIYRLEMDLATGKLSAPVLAAKVTNPSFLAVHPSRRYLYAVGEMSEFEGKKVGAVSAFSLNAKTGELKLLNQQPSGGAGPCHVVVDGPGKNVLVANYGGGSAAVLPIRANGQLAKASDVEQHQGSSINPKRQTGPHAHSVNVDSASQFAFVADLGLDKVMVYRLDSDTGTLTPNNPAFAAVSPGAGPRHFAFHPDGKRAYVINELKNTIVAMDYDAAKGTLKKKQEISTLPNGFKGTSYTAEVVVHPSGRYVYGSNRGDDSIAVFAVEEKTGKLRSVSHPRKGIKTPRNFNVDPTGRYVIVANQDADTLVVFRVDENTGTLLDTGIVAQVPRPVCVKFVPRG